MAGTEDVHCESEISSALSLLVNSVLFRFSDSFWQ